jgi:transcriptional regulator CtsR
METEQLIEKYIQTLNDKEKQAIEIAKNHLESSFDIEKSVGFVKFKNDTIKK